jgi:4-amino-4-deoxychorismate lyase
MRFLETIRIESGKALHLPFHQARLERTLRHFGGDAIFDLSALLCAPPQGLYRCRVAYDLEVYSITYHPYTPAPMRTFRLVHNDTIDYGFKYTDRAPLDALQRYAPPYDSVLIVKNGYVTDTPIANVAFLKEGRWFTPDTPLLYGTTRARLIAEQRLHVRPIRAEAIAQYEGFALLNALVDFYPVQDGIMALKS